MENDQNKYSIKSHDDCIKCGAPTSNRFIDSIDGRTCSSCISKAGIPPELVESAKKYLEVFFLGMSEKIKLIYPQKENK